MSRPLTASSSSATRVAALLAEEVRLLQLFLDTLGREQTRLSQGVVDDLTALAEEKSALAGQLAALCAEREGVLSPAPEGGRAAMLAWLDSPAGKEQRPLWSRLLELAAQARNLNEINGKLVALHLQNNQQALATLLAAGGQLVTYGPDGQQQGGGSGRSLGSA